MKITDTHAHLYMKEFKNDIHHVIKRAMNQGINRFFLPSISSSSISDMIELENKYPNICFPMIGLHPNNVFPKTIEIELNNIKKYLNQHRFISIGETGIDLHFNKKFLIEQEYAFVNQIKLAKENKLPIIIHCRNSFHRVIKILENNSYSKGVFHCFSGNLKEAIIITDLGMKLGIGGIITFKNNHIDEFLHKISIKNIVLETDSPYLSPYPFRGERNEPSRLKVILNKLSKIYSISEKMIAKYINKNVDDLFFN
ncbi:TatD family hydrolase [Blattabacterium cuenoti]|uniref:TatD family hydrolase n=1 Tax=Blattabacterium cuenoti TaxID=1653831 RepID=UPI00163BC119|nr:TatD family hydrolase [Blattabacterium cuenoti]